jgi:hypothetical protein
MYQSFIPHRSGTASRNGSPHRNLVTPPQVEPRVRDYPRDGPMRRLSADSTWNKPVSNHTASISPELQAPPRITVSSPDELGPGIEVEPEWVERLMYSSPATSTSAPRAAIEFFEAKPHGPGLSRKSWEAFDFEFPDNSNARKEAGAQPLVDAEGELGHLPRNMVLYTRADDTPVFGNATRDSASVNEDSFLNQSSIMDSPLYNQSMKAQAQLTKDRAAALAALEGNPSLQDTQRNEQANVSLLKTKHATSDLRKHRQINLETRPSNTTPAPGKQPTSSTNTSHTLQYFRNRLPRTLPNMRAFITNHVVRAFSSYVIGYIVTTLCPRLHNYIITPWDLLAYSLLHPERFFGAVILAIIVGQYVLPLLIVLLEQCGELRRREVFSMVGLVWCFYMGAMLGTV